ncbi:hypothetical protein ACC713_35670, partial [Rhizobium johnstonii]
MHPALLARLKTCEPRRFPNQVPFLEYLAANGIDIFDKDIIRPFAEAGIWGAIRHHGLVGNAVIVSDVTIGGRKHWLWRAVDQDGYVLDEIV